MSKCGFEKVKRPFSQNRGDLKKHLGVREKTCYSFYANLLWFWNKLLYTFTVVNAYVYE